MSLPIRILTVANKRLPDNDYRIAYQKFTSVADIVYGLPDRSAALRPEQFLPLGFGEGLQWRDARGFWMLLRHLQRQRDKYDLVHFFSTKLQLLGPLCAALAGVHCVTTVTGFGRTFNRQQLRYRLLRPTYLSLARVSIRLAQATFFQNRGDMRWLAERMPALRHKLHWIGSGVDAQAVQDKDFASQPLKVLMAARIMADKGVAVFLECAARLAGRGFQFLFAGPASVGQQGLYQQVLAAQRTGAIEYLGELAAEDLSRRYAECHVLAFPSRGEGMPRVMLEAGHHLMCPVASDIPAHRDLIAPGGGFLLTAGEELDSLVGHLVYLQADRAELARTARAYQRHVLEHYSLGAYSRRMDDYLRGAVAHRLSATASRLEL